MTTPRVGVIIRHEDEYLSVFQDASKLWGFPKGRIKYYESYKEGACRELSEETNINIHPDVLSNNEMIHIKRGKHHHYYFIHKVNSKPEVKVDNYEIIDYKWTTLEDFSRVRVSFFTEQVLKRLKN